MSPQDSENKERLNICILGADHQGKSQLASALSIVCAKERGGTSHSYSGLYRPTPSYLGKMKIAHAPLHYESEKRSYHQTDCENHMDIIKSLMFGPETPAGAILVVDSTSPDGTSYLVRDQITMAKQAGINDLVIFINFADILVESSKGYGNEAYSERLELVEYELAELFEDRGYIFDDIPIVVGSAYMATNGEDSNGLGTTAINKLLSSMDECFKTPAPKSMGDFWMPVVDVVEEDGVTLWGDVLRGELTAGSDVQIVGNNESRVVKCEKVTDHGDVVEKVSAGDVAALTFSNVKAGEVAPGQSLISPKSMSVYSIFEADVYALSHFDTGKRNPIKMGKTELCFHRKNTGATLRLRDQDFDANMIRPGTYPSVIVKLDKSHALEEGQRFEVRDDSTVLGYGIITELYHW